MTQRIASDCGSLLRTLLVLRARRGEKGFEQHGLLGKGRPHLPDIIALQCLRETLVGGDHAGGEFGRRHPQPPAQMRGESAEKNHTLDRRKPAV